MVSFTNDEKSMLFDKIASHFYKQNFGSFSKSDFDLLMFHFYMEKILSNSSIDGSIDYSKCSDYKISKELGITQQRVRNLKIKNQLVYPDDKRNWKEEFARLIENARIDNNKIVISIPDPNLYIEIENYLDENGSFIEKQLNSKLMIMRIEYFIDLCLLFEEKSSRKKVINSIKEQCKASNADLRKIENNHVGRSLLGVVTNTTSFLANIVTCFSSYNTIAISFGKLLQNYI